MREQESIVELATEGAPVRKAKEGRDRSAPVYFRSADNDPPEPSETKTRLRAATCSTSAKGSDLRWSSTSRESGQQSDGGAEGWRG